MVNIFQLVIYCWLSFIEHFSARTELYCYGLNFFFFFWLAMGAFIIVEMLFNFSLLAIVGAGEQVIWPSYLQRVL